MPSARTRTGTLGEELAARFLTRSGMTVIARNYRTRFGEVDIVARDTDGVVFVEVRTRRSTAFGTAEESLILTKRRHLVLAALQYLQDQRLEQQPWRVDVVTVALSGPEPIIAYYRAIELPAVP